MANKEKVKAFLDNLFFPKDIKCKNCGEEVFENSAPLCADCEKELIFNNDKICSKCGSPSKKSPCPFCKNEQIYFRKARSPFIYDGTIKNLIHKLKYDGKKNLAPFFGEYLVNQIVECNFKFDVIIPVPLSLKRQKERGFNQSELIADEIAKAFVKPVETDTLIRIKETPSQTSLSFEARAENLKGAFVCKATLVGKSILLVDDVFTTGATAKSCSKALMDAGAKEVFVLTVAHTIKD